MPELPEVEVVRRGLVRWVRGRTIADVDVLDVRSIRRHRMGVEDLRGTLIGARVADVARRGKYLWMPLAPPDHRGADDDGAHDVGADGDTDGDGAGEPGSASRVALMAHLGMSGQLLIEDADAPDEKHLRVRLRLGPGIGDDGRADGTRGAPGEGVPGDDAPSELRFVDQRIFGGLFVADLVDTPDKHPGGLSETGLARIPAEVAHIGRDPLDPHFSPDALYQRLRARRSGIKRALLDQSLVSGIGNIYADEALWAARLHYARPTDTLRRPEVLRLIEACRAVMTDALAAGGTSFDSLYVNVNGASGYFSRDLNVYGRSGQPCKRCGTPIVREKFMNRSSYFCPSCQRKR